MEIIDILLYIKNNLKYCYITKTEEEGLLDMNKTESLARRVLGWKLNRWDRWYDYEKSAFIPASDFQPEENIDHAMLLVDRLEKSGFKYSTNGVSEVCFNDVSATGHTLAQAITNAAYLLVEKSSIADRNEIWRQLC